MAGNDPPPPTKTDIDKVTTFDRSNLGIFTKLYGSVWPKVLPFCVVNVVSTYAIHVLRSEYGVDLTFRQDGHGFVSVMISFLVVTRSQNVFARYMEARSSLEALFRSCREVVQHVCVITGHRTDEAARLWREEVAFRVITLVRITLKSLEHKSTGQASWEGEPSDVLKDVNRNRAYLPDENNLDANLRMPYVLAYHLRKLLLEQRVGAFRNKDDDDDARLHIVEELKILGDVSAFLSAWTNLKKFMTTPYPFPLVQLGRLFLFFWIYSLPFVLSANRNDVVQTIVLMFFITYGYAGLEYVSIELDDPFGDDPNDFDDQVMAKQVIGDILLLMSKTDGPQCELNLKNRANLVTRARYAVDQSLEESNDEFFDAAAKSPETGPTQTTISSKTILSSYF